VTTTVAAGAGVWTDSQGVPVCLVWQGQRYRVTDTPTPLDLDLEAVTHLTAWPVGWRFQGTNEAGLSVMFDVVSFDSALEWRVIRTYH
jgi:hypothetical protein